MEEIIEEARIQYMRSSVSRVTVHITDNVGTIRFVESLVQDHSSSGV